MKIGTLEIARKRLVRKMIKEGYEIINEFPTNKGRYSIISFKGKKIMMMFKREHFHNFGIQFQHLGYSGMGETINVADLENAIDHDVTEIFSIFPNGFVYHISVVDFLSKALLWTNKEGKEVYSISIHELKKVYDLA